MKWFPVLLVGHLLTSRLKWRCEITELQRLILLSARTVEDGNCDLMLERVELGRRPPLPCPSPWICAPWKIMATTS